MQKYMRWSGLLVVLMLVLAACSGGSGSSAAPESAGESAGASAGGDPTAVCEADEFGCVEVADGEPIVLGTALVITTADADLGQDSQYGAHIAGDMRNEDGGIKGHQIEWDDQDDECSADGGTAAARALTADEQIVAIIGTSCSSAGVPASAIASDAGVLMVSSSNTAPSLTAPDTHEPFYARTAHNDEVQGAAMATFVCEEFPEITMAATLHDTSPYSEQLQQVFADQFVEQCGGEIVYQGQVSPTETNFSDPLDDIEAAGAQLVYYPIFTAGGIAMTQQARERAEFDGVMLAGADGMQSGTFAAEVGEAGNGLYTSGPDLAFSNAFYEDTFLPAYYELCGCDATLSVFHAHAFDAASLILDAIDAVSIEGDDGTLYIPRTALRDEFFSTTDYEGITGILTCDENGDCADPKISVSIIEGDAEGVRTYSRIWPEE
jgi:branched-chain amino acid transport system substrate-binding protein